MTVYLVSDNAVSALANGADPGATALALAEGTGARFPEPGAGQAFFITLGTDLDNEVVECTARSGDLLTTAPTARGWSIGTRVSLRMCSALFAQLVQVADVGSLQGPPGADGHSPVLAFGAGADADRITIDGVASGPHLTGPQGDRGGNILRANWVRASGSSIQVPVGEVMAHVDQAATITKVVILTRGGPGSCVVDIWRKPRASYPPTAVDSICGGAKPTIAADQTYADATLAGWSTALNADDTLLFHLESSSGFQALTVFLYLN